MLKHNISIWVVVIISVSFIKFKNASWEDEWISNAFNETHLQQSRSQIFDCVCLNDPNYCRTNFSNDGNETIEDGTGVSEILKFEKTSKKSISLRETAMEGGYYVRVTTTKISKIEYEICCYTNFPNYGINMTKDRNVYYITLYENRPAAHFWCKAYNYESKFLTILSNVIVAQNRAIHLYDYTYILKIYNNSEENNASDSYNFDDYNANYFGNDYNYLDSSFDTANVTNTTWLDNFHSIGHLGDIPIYKNLESNVTIHIALKKNNESYEENYWKLAKHLEYFNLTSPNATFVCTTTCLALNESNHTFPDANIGEIVVPPRSCLKTDGTPLRRKCTGNFLYGAKWGVLDQNCSETQNGMVSALYDLLDIAEDNAALQELSSLITSQQTATPYEIYLYAKILERLSHSTEEIDMDLCTDVISDVMDLNVATLQHSQINYNATDIMLNSFDRILRKSSQEGVVVKSNIAVFMANAKTRLSVNGAAFYHKNDKIEVKTWQDSDYSRDDLMFSANFKSLQCKNKCNLAATVFKSSVLFNQAYWSDLEVISWVGSVVFDGKITDAIDLEFKTFRTYRKNQYCAYWDYGINKIWESFRGDWAIEMKVSNDKFLVCSVTHLTHFTILIGKKNEGFLNLFTLIGSGLSVLGTTGIIVTTLMNKTWRENTGTHVLLNFCIAILFQMLLLYPIDSIDSLEDKFLCQMFGIALHYTILAQFCWMLVIAYMHYHKFVVVLTVEPKYLLVKAYIVGWMLPIIPVAATVVISIDSYVLDQYCYLTENGLYYGALLPICLVLLINFYIFYKILISVLCSRVKSYGSKHVFIILQLRLVLVLFFLLGFSWVFGLLAGFLESPVWSYLFCLITTLQGFVMFLFHVVFNKNSRQIWKRKFNSRSNFSKLK